VSIKGCHHSHRSPNAPRAGGWTGVRGVFRGLVTGRPQNEEPGIQSIDIGVGGSGLTGTWLGEYFISFGAMKSWLERLMAYDIWEANMSEEGRNAEQQNTRFVHSTKLMLTATWCLQDDCFSPCLGCCECRIGCWILYLPPINFSKFSGGGHLASFSYIVSAFLVPSKLLWILPVRFNYYRHFRYKKSVVLLVMCL